MYFHINLALFIVSIFLIALYYFVRLYFTYQYRKAITLRIESRNDVISNRDIDDIVKEIQKQFELKEWTVNYGDLKFANFGRGINFHNKTIDIARLPMTSVGYELDYVVSRLWYVKEINNKHYLPRMFSFLSNWWMKIMPYLAIVLFLLQAVIFFYGFGFDKGTKITNEGMKWLYDFPLIFILVFVCIVSIGFGWSMLGTIKFKLEEQYTKDTLKVFKDKFPNYSFDFKTARTYSQRISIGYNLALIQKNEERLQHWLGPFLNY